MQKRLELLYRALLVLLALGVFWCVWGIAPRAMRAAENVPATNAVAVATSTNAPVLRVDLLPNIDREYLTFGLDRIPFLKDRHFLGIALWQYIASFLFIFLAFYFAKIIDFLTRVWLRRWADRTETRADDLLLDLADGPVKVVVFVVFLHVGLSVFDWPPTVERWLGNALKVVVAASLTYAVLKLVDLVVGAWRRRTTEQVDQGLDRELLPIIRRALKAVVIVVAVLVTLDNVGINITGFIASLSIGGLALGLAAQDTVANLFGAVAVLIDKPFKIGDRVQFDGIDGVVESIGLRATRIRSQDGFLVTVPNKAVGNAAITNVSSRPTIRTLMTIGLTYDTPPERIERATRLLEEIFRAHPCTHDVLVGFNRFGDFSLNLSITHWWREMDPKAHLAGMHELHLEIKRRFEAEKIEFAFPTQTVLVRQEPGPGAVA